jgi:hypothetical protein
VFVARDGAGQVEGLLAGTEETAGLDRELELLLRGSEHRSAGERAEHLPGPEVAWLRAEMRLDRKQTGSSERMARVVEQPTTRGAA